MPLTAKQISDLNNSMVAAQNINLGTLLNTLNSSKSVSGSVVPDAAVYTLATGLTSVTSATVSLSGSPTLNHNSVTVASGSVAGTIVISSWKPTNASTVTLIPATSPFAKVSWIAVGE